MRGAPLGLLLVTLAGCKPEAPPAGAAPDQATPPPARDLRAAPRDLRAAEDLLAPPDLAPPDLAPRPAPRFALLDVNPNSASRGMRLGWPSYPGRVVLVAFAGGS